MVKRLAGAVQLSRPRAKEWKRFLFLTATRRGGRRKDKSRVVAEENTEKVPDTQSNHRV